MYLFTRTRRLSDGNGTAGVEWARSIATRVTNLTGHEIQLWGTVYSARYGTISWTGWFHDLRAIETLGDTLAGDPAMEKLANAGTKYSAGGRDDSLVKLIHGTPPDRSAAYVAEVVAVAAPGSMARAAAAGVAIAKTAESITGVPVLFGRSMTGPYRQVHWFTPYESVTAMETADAALAGDPAWIELLDSGTDAFIADATMPAATIYRRLG